MLSKQEYDNLQLNIREVLNGFDTDKLELIYLESKYIIEDRILKDIRSVNKEKNES